MKKKEFGFYPKPLQIEEGAITIDTLPDLGDNVEDVSSGRVGNGWTYSPLRVFGLPKTHMIKHTEAMSDKHIDFHVWVLSFFVGMRLTTTEAGFVDAAPIKPFKLIDFTLCSGIFYLSDTALSHVIRLAEDFWTKNLNKPRNAELIVAAIHTLYLGQRPQNLQFESFTYLYTAIDICYALAKKLKKLSVPKDEHHTHGRLINHMCKGLGIKVPKWGVPDSQGKCELSKIRNATLHEGLYEGAPLGYNINKDGAFGNLPLEMSNLICRLLVALIGGNDKSYLGSPVDTRQRIRLCLD